jgi:hypothetical protein
MRKGLKPGGIPGLRAPRRERKRSAACWGGAPRQGLGIGTGGGCRSNESPLRALTGDPPAQTARQHKAEASCWSCPFWRPL